ncbi:MAG: LicD family protein [Atopobiaceae bacterium]|jgi:lipopolysaccharide cholinephosphotransferase|nr:LicD family protein [Atopobiaceae bacterium]
MNLSTVAQLKNMSSSMMVVPDDEQLRLLQSILLRIIDDITCYCDERGLCYALGGGSSLGAIRHHGFIPWDDDVDFDMPRKDYDKFIKGFSEQFSDKYVVQSPETTPSVGLPMARVRLKGTVARTHEDTSNPDCGIFVDIFVIENTFNNPVLRNLHGFACMAMGLLYSCRRFYRDKDFYLSFAGGNEDFARAVRVKAAIGRLLSLQSMDSWTHAIVATYSLCKDDSSRYVAVPAGRDHFFKELYPRDEFAATRRERFEGRLLNVPKECEKYLEHHYGDYLAIPSKDEQEHHAYLELSFGDENSRGMEKDGE